MSYMSDVKDLLSDYVILLERQVSSYDRASLQEFVEYLGTKKDIDFPDLLLGEDMTTVFFAFPAGRKEKITDENIRPCMEYIKFLKNGIS